MQAATGDDIRDELVAENCLVYNLEIPSCEVMLLYKWQSEEVELKASTALPPSMPMRTAMVNEPLRFVLYLNQVVWQSQEEAITVRFKLDYRSTDWALGGCSLGVFEMTVLIIFSNQRLLCPLR